MRLGARCGIPVTTVALLAWFTAACQAMAPPLPGARPASEDEWFRSGVAAASAIVIADVRVLDHPVTPPGRGNTRPDLYSFDLEVTGVTWLKGRSIALRYVAHHRLLHNSGPALPTGRSNRAMLFLEQPSRISGSGIDPSVWYVDGEGFKGGVVPFRDEREAVALSERVKTALASQTIPALARAADLVVYGTGFRDSGVVCAPFGRPVVCPLFHVERSLLGGREGEMLRIFSLVQRWLPTERHALVFLRRAPGGCFEVLQPPAGAIEFDSSGHDELGVPAVERLAAVRAALVGSRKRH